MFDQVETKAGAAAESPFKFDAMKGMTEPGTGNSNGTGSADANLVIDLENASTAVFEAVPPGIYAAKVENTEYGLSQSSNPMITVSYRLTEGEYAKRLMYDHYVLNNDFGVGRLKIFMQRICPEYPLSTFKPEDFCNNMVATGRACRLKLAVKMYQGTRRNNVKEVLEAAMGDKFFGQ